LVGAGFAVLAVDVVAPVFAACVAAVFVAIVDVVFVAVVAAVFVAIVDAVLVVLAVFAGFALAAVLFAVSPPQAAPNAARPKNAESAIAFFMLKTFSCLLQRLV